MRRCEDACAKCPYLTQYAMLPSSKGEDNLTVASWGSEEAIWAVFDGHRSKDVSSHAATTIADLVKSNRYWPSAPDEALREAITECHELARCDRLKGGSTAVVVVAVNGMLWCGNAGDSHALVGLRDGGLRRLSTDHRPSSQIEAEFTNGNVKLSRIGGLLAISRGIGNFDFEADGFCCKADVSSVPIADVDFLVVASDGLFDYIDEGTCCRAVRSAGVRDAAGCLVQRARERGSRDDITAIVVHFSHAPTANLFGA